MAVRGVKEKRERNVGGNRSGTGTRLGRRKQLPCLTTEVVALLAHSAGCCVNCLWDSGRLVEQTTELAHQLAPDLWIQRQSLEDRQGRRRCGTRLAVNRLTSGPIQQQEVISDRDFLVFAVGADGDVLALKDNRSFRRPSILHSEKGFSAFSKTYQIVVCQSVEQCSSRGT